tara:strand:+ start:121 stop:684 length:564 start_codon:yes stop_codon:yes gene_type:complete
MAMFFKSGRRFGQFKRDIKLLPDDLRELLNEATRYSTLEIINDLAEEGPVWNGNFQDNWIAIPIGKGASGNAGGTYPYQITDIPQLSLKTKEVGRVKKFEIVNISEYAEYALDLKPGKFYPRYRLNPIKNPVDTGKRDNSRETFRGQLTSNRGNAKSTAELDWYTTYVKGGKIKSALAKGVKFGFKP